MLPGSGGGTVYVCVCGGGLTIQHVMLLFSATYLISALDCDLGLKTQSFSNSVCQESDDQGFS